MSLFSTLFNVGVARRVGIWALIQALPDEDDLRQYLRAVYMGLAGVIIGSVLTGSAIAAGMVAAYRALTVAGWTEPHALAATAGFTLLLIVVCFTLAGRWFVQLANIKNDIDPFKHNKAHSLGTIVNDAVNSVTEGFIEGLTAQPPIQKTTRSASGRRIRLIN